MDKVFRVYGKVVKVSGVYLEATVPEGAVGNQCIIKTETGDVEGEVIGFHENRCLIMPFSSLLGVKTGDKVWIKGNLYPPLWVKKLWDKYWTPLVGEFPTEA
jgi:flagellum-specific ATP synthase